MIGVIGANGVAATNMLCELIEERVTQSGAFRDAHHPEMIIWQASQVPSRSLYLEGRGPSFIEDYVRIGLAMKALGCDKLCMCCNTAYYAVEELETKIGLPFYNIPDDVAFAVKELRHKCVGIMCGDGCRKGLVYDKAFGKICPETKIIYPDEEFQVLVTKGICNAKNTSRNLPTTNPDSPVYCFDSVARHLLSRGCDCIVVGCTDIYRIWNSETSELAQNNVVIDSLLVLAEDIADSHLENKTF